MPVLQEDTQPLPLMLTDSPNNLRENTKQSRRRLRKKRESARSSPSNNQRADLENNNSATIKSNNKGNTSMNRSLVKSKENFYSIKLETWITESLHPQEV